jgi:methylated-DNA-protein-cysteine methyltransferase-like protein
MQAKESIYKAIYDIVRAIPMGRVSSYGAIANAIGAKGAARMVGYAMNLSHGITPMVPAHRVVNRNGYLTGKHHFETPKQMEILLKKEGIQVVDDQIVDFEKFFWDPMIEL